MADAAPTKPGGMEPIRTGPLIILSGPSGSGKTTVVELLLRPGDLPVRMSVSATTRARRPGELDGKHYYFWTHERFEQQIQAGGFLEWARVHGEYYGTLKSEVEPYLRHGTGVLLDIDTQGAAQVRQLYPRVVSVFLCAPSQAAYEARLRARATETEEAIRRRLAVVQKELALADQYQHRVVNDDVATAVAALRKIIEQSFNEGSYA